MNKLKIFALMLLTAAFAACSDDGKDVSDNGIKQIAKESTEIPALGGEGSVTMDKPVASAYAKDAWLKVATDGNTVKFSADKYTERESRLTELVVKASAEDSTIVSVKQYGYIFNAESVKDLTVAYTASQQVVPVTSTEKLTVTASPEWITATPTDNGLQLNIALNTSTERTGTVSFEAGGYKGSVKVTQDAINPLFGNYIIGGTNSKGQFTTLACQLTKTGIVLPDLGWTIPATWDEKTFTLTLTNGSYLGTYSSYFVYLLLPNDQDKITFSPVTGTFTLQFDEEIGGFYAELAGTDDWKSSGVVFGAFGAKSFTYDNYVGNLLSLTGGVALMSYNESASAASAQSSKASRAGVSSTSAIKKLKGIQPLNITKLHLTK